MAVAQKTAAPNSTRKGGSTAGQAEPDVAKAAAPKGLLKIGDIVHLVNGGRTLQHYEVLDMDEHFIKFRANVQNAPQTEIVLIPWDKIEALGLPNER